MHAAKVFKLLEGGSSFTAAVDPGVPPISGDHRGTSHLGDIYFLTDTQLGDATPTGTNVTGKAGLYALANAQFDESYMYIANSGTLKAVEDLGEYVGAPSVKNVFAHQILGSKDVGIEYFQQFDSSKATEVYIEVWFREALDSAQWRRCFDLSDLTEKTDYNGETVAHTSTYNGSPAWITWNAGSEIPNFKGDNCTIRVMAIYPKQYEGGGGLLPDDQQGSGWDGYDIELGDMFVRTSDTQIDVKHPDYPVEDAYAANEHFLAYLTQTNIERQGTTLIDGKNFPVFFLTTDDIQQVTGVAGIEAGNYAFSGLNEFLDNGAISFECIIGRVIPQSL